MFCSVKWKCNYSNNKHDKICLQTRYSPVGLHLELLLIGRRSKTSRRNETHEGGKQWRQLVGNFGADISQLPNMRAHTWGHRLMFLPEFHAGRSIPLQRNATSLYSFLLSFCASLAQGAHILIREIWVQPTYAFKLLSGSVKVCRSYARKSDL